MGWDLSDHRGLQNLSAEFDSRSPCHTIGVFMEENRQIVRCPKCNSENVEAVEPFDYVKQCQNDNCSYYLNHPKRWRYQFSTGVHN